MTELEKLQMQKRQNEEWQKQDFEEIKNLQWNIDFYTDRINKRTELLNKLDEMLESCEHNLLKGPLKNEWSATRSKY